MFWKKLIPAILLSIVVGSVIGAIAGLLRNQEMDIYATILIGASGAISATVVFLLLVRNKIKNQ
jgi:uncharacterized membrane protein YeaQ/YmgE (transglycosylase-associated protein family)